MKVVVTDADGYKETFEGHESVEALARAFADYTRPDRFRTIEYLKVYHPKDEETVEVEVIPSRY